MNRPTALAALLAMCIVTACGLAPTPATTSDALGNPAPSAEPDSVFGLDPPPGEAIRFDGASLSADGSTLTLRFTGGKEYDPDDPCSTRYRGWASEVEGTLVAKIVDDTPPFVIANPQLGCDAIGYGRTLAIQLKRPFAGARVHDLAGYDLFVRRPEGVATITIPPGWTPAGERTVEESPTGRWQQSWTKGEPGEANRGRIDLYQAFGGPVNVTGGDEVRQGIVSGNPATLYRASGVGELVLVWTLAGDGLALVVNESDFPVEVAVQLAETVTIP